MLRGCSRSSASRFVPPKRQIKKMIAVSVILIGMVFAMQINGYCQINTATLSGNVKDSSGAVLSGASVVARQATTGISRTVVTNEGGFFNVPLLQPGQYDVTVSKQGFQTTEEHIQLQVNQLANLNVLLTVGGVQQTVNVTGATPELQTETAGLGSVIGTREINDLPLNGRQFVQLLQLAPGTVPVSVSQTAVSAIGSAGST